MHATVHATTRRPKARSAPWSHANGISGGSGGGDGGGGEEFVPFAGARRRLGGLASIGTARRRWAAGVQGQE